MSLTPDMLPIWELREHLKQRDEQVASLRADIETMRSRKDGAYEERNKVVAALSKVFPAGVARTAIEGWSDDWHGCVYIDLPTGQVSWHFHDSQAHLFAHLPAYNGGWDGHDTPEKYRRLAELPSASGITSLRAEVERLRAALGWYADRENWKRRVDPYEEGRAYPPKANLDNGDKARAALNTQETSDART